MKVARKENLPTEITLNIELEPDDIEPYLQRAYRKVVSRVNVPGFRKGKAPRAVLEGLVGKDHLLHEVLDSLVSEKVEQAVGEEKIEPYIQPDVEIESLDPLSIKAIVPMEPQVTLDNYRGIHLELEPTQVKDENVDEVIEKLRSESAPWEPTESSVMFQDLLIIDVEGVVEGRTVVSNQGVEYIPYLDNPLPLPGFSVHLEGLEKGATKTFDLKVPEQYQDASVAGRDCRFSVTIHEVKRKALPDLDNEFAKGVGEGYEDLQSLRDSILENLTSVADKHAADELHNRALEQVIATANVEVPDLIINRHLDFLYQDQVRTLEARRIDMDTYLQQVGKSEEQLREELRPAAKERLVRSLVMNQLAREEHIEVADAEVEEEITGMFSGSNRTDQTVKRAMSSREVRGSVRSSILARKTLERLAEIVQDKTNREQDVETSVLDRGGTKSDC